MAGKSYLKIGANNRPALQPATQASAGVANANDIVALDANGTLDPSLFPAGLGPDVKSVIAVANITAPKVVEIYDNGGTLNCRIADYSNGREAIGYIKDNATLGQPVNVYFDGISTGWTSLTLGAEYFLSTAGGITTSPTVSGSGAILQSVGMAISATELAFESGEPIDLA